MNVYRIHFHQNGNHSLCLCLNIKGCILQYNYMTIQLTFWKIHFLPEACTVPQYCRGGLVPCFLACPPIFPQATLDDRTVFGLANIYLRIQLVQPKLFLYPSDTATDRAGNKLIFFSPFLRQDFQAELGAYFYPPANMKCQSFGCKNRRAG